MSCKAKTFLTYACSWQNSNILKKSFEKVCGIIKIGKNFFQQEVQIWKNPIYSFSSIYKVRLQKEDILKRQLKRLFSYV